MKGDSSSAPLPGSLQASRPLFQRDFIERQTFYEPFTSLGFGHQMILKLASEHVRVLEYIQEDAIGKSTSNAKEDRPSCQNMGSN